MTTLGTVNTDVLNLRASPSTSAAVIMILKQNTQLQVVSETDANWLEVIVNGNTKGYVARQYITVAKLEGSGSGGSGSSGDSGVNSGGSTGGNDGSNQQRAEVITDSLNVRNGAGTNFAVITAIPKGTVVNVIAVQGDWVKVKVGLNEGFVSKQFVDLNTKKQASGYLIEQVELLHAPLIPTRKIPDQPVGTKEFVIARTWNNYGGLLSRLSELIDCPLNGIVATLTAESGGNCFGPDGRPIIRFENHIFYNYWGKDNENQFNGYFQFNRTSGANGWKDHKFRANANSNFEGFHGNQAKEYQVLSFARALNDTAALFSISIGAPQIMGFNFRRLGYDSVQNMYAQFSRSANAQLLAMFDFVRGTSTNSPAITALRTGDYLTFATIYNGSGNAPTYRNIIANYVATFDKLIGTAR